MEENLGAFEEKRNEAAETAESAGKGGKHLAKEDGPLPVSRSACWLRRIWGCAPTRR